jgi:hypothetical protein
MGMELSYTQKLEDYHLVWSADSHLRDFVDRRVKDGAIRRTIDKWLAQAALSRQVAYFGAAYIVLLGIWWLARQELQCLHVTMPFLGMLVFGITVVFQYPIIQPFRDAGRDRAAFAVLLVLEAVMMFLNGETMAIDHYRKGLEHFQKDQRPIWSIPSSDGAEFFFDARPRCRSHW